MWKCYGVLNVYKFSSLLLASENRLTYRVVRMCFVFGNVFVPSDVQSHCSISVPITVNAPLSRNTLIPLSSSSNAHGS